VPTRERRTQADRRARSRAALLEAAARGLSRHGYGNLKLDAVAADAGYTRGALYHQFADKRDLFRAVVEDLEQEVIGRLDASAASAATIDEALAATIGGWLEICEEPEVQRIMLLDAPGVLGWEEWREIGLRYGLGATMALLESAMEQGAIARQPVRPLAHVVVGALDEAALYVARAEDRATARAEMDEVLARLFSGLR
jgi:AcrR family transcriptional regulator